MKEVLSFRDEGVRVRLSVTNLVRRRCGLPVALSSVSEILAGQHVGSESLDVGLVSDKPGHLGTTRSSNTGGSGRCWNLHRDAFNRRQEQSTVMARVTNMQRRQDAEADLGRAALGLDLGLELTRSWSHGWRRTWSEPAGSVCRGGRACELQGSLKRSGNGAARSTRLAARRRGALARGGARGGRVGDDLGALLAAAELAGPTRKAGVGGEPEVEEVTQARYSDAVMGLTWRTGSRAERADDEVTVVGGARGRTDGRRAGGRRLQGRGRGTRGVSRGRGWQEQEES